MWAVVFVVRFTHLAFKAWPDLSANSNAITNLHARLAIRADLNSCANYLVPNTQWQTGPAPTTTNSVYI
jgi:hypothetical protein